MLIGAPRNREGRLGLWLWGREGWSLKERGCADGDCHESEG